MGEEKAVSIRIDHDPQTRKGVHADFVIARTDGAATRLDFIQNDIPLEGGDIGAVLVSRVFMSNEGLVALRDMLDAHIKTAGIEEDDE